MNGRVKKLASPGCSGRLVGCGRVDADLKGEDP